jgi:hypothetical protein
MKAWQSGKRGRKNQFEQHKKRARRKLIEIKVWN